MKNIEIDYKQKFLTRVMNTTGKPVGVKFEALEATVKVFFNDILTEDPSSKISLFYTSTFGTPDAVSVKDLEGRPIAEGKEVNGLQEFKFKTLAPLAGVGILIVALGLNSQWTSTRTVIFPNIVNKASLYNELYVMSIEDRIYC